MSNLIITTDLNPIYSGENKTISFSDKSVINLQDYHRVTIKSAWRNEVIYCSHSCWDHFTPADHADWVLPGKFNLIGKTLRCYISLNKVITGND
jgi:hypothetical protein